MIIWLWPLIYTIFLLNGSPWNLLLINKFTVEENNANEKTTASNVNWREYNDNEESKKKIQ